MNSRQVKMRVKLYIGFWLRCVQLGLKTKPSLSMYQRKKRPYSRSSLSHHGHKCSMRARTHTHTHTHTPVHTCIRYLLEWREKKDSPYGERTYHIHIFPVIPPLTCSYQDKTKTKTATKTTKHKRPYLYTQPDAFLSRKSKSENINK